MPITFDFQFQEIPLSVGQGKSGKQQNVALVSGEASIVSHGRGRDIEWYIDGVTLEGPLAGDDGVLIEFGHRLWNDLVVSIERVCGDRIWDAAADATRPDPDAMRDRWLDAVREAVEP